jgi:hypothetical protein
MPSAPDGDQPGCSARAGSPEVSDPGCQSTSVPLPLRGVLQAASGSVRLNEVLSEITADRGRLQKSLSPVSGANVRTVATEAQGT